MALPQAGPYARERMRAGKILLEIMQKFNLAKPSQPLLAGKPVGAFDRRILYSAIVIPALVCTRAAGHDDISCHPGHLHPDYRPGSGQEVEPSHKPHPGLGRGG